MKRSFKRFIREAWHVVEPSTPLVDGWHIDVIADHLQAVTEGRIKRLLINIPPGFMKSLITAVFWPAWSWSRRPGWRAVFSSYAESLALRDSVRCRDLIESDWYQRYANPTKAWNLAVDQNRKDYFGNTKYGARIALGVEGKVTGLRGDVFVVDDPHNAMDAESKALRESAVEWYFKATTSRLNDPRTGARVVIMQRLHQADLAGTLIEKGGYEVLCLPLEFDPARRCTTSIWTDPRTQPGESLFPAMFTPEVIAELKREMGSSAWAGQYNQDPIPDGGGKFKRDWWRFWKPEGFGDRQPRPKGSSDAPAVLLPERFDEVVASWDCTFKKTDDTDFVACVIVGRKGAFFYVLDHLCERMSFTDTLRAMKRMHAKWPQARSILVEDKANGPAVIDTLAAEVHGIIGVNPEGGKEARAAAIEPSVEAAQVFLPDGSNWLEKWFNEFESFPKGTHDDRVDALSQALIRMLPSRTSFAERFKAAHKAGKVQVPQQRKLLALRRRVV